MASSYESVCVFDGKGSSLKMNMPDKDGYSLITVSQSGIEVEFLASIDKQSDIIKHFTNFNPPSIDLAIRRISYESLTLKGHFDTLIESYRLLKIENERLKILLQK